MRWFDKEEIKGKEGLAPEHIAYLLQPSLTVWAPLNCIFRKHFDYLLAYTLVMMGVELISKPEEIGLLSVICLLIGAFLEGWIIYFFIKHGRRLAWNRSQWIDFEAFKASENRWRYLTVFSFCALVIQLVMIGMQEEEELTRAIEAAAVLFYGLSIALPFFQAWRRGIDKIVPDF